jgi:histidinol-phosphate aminotransferase
MIHSLPHPKPYLAHIAPYKAGKTALAPDITPIKLSSNENPYGASPKALAAYHEAASSLHRYPEGSCAKLRAALAEIYQLQAERIVCGAGSDELIGLLVHAYAGQGDEVLFTEHGFLMYKIYTLAAGATPVEAKETNLKADSDALIAAITERTKIIFLANPNNPTGSYLNAAELRALHARIPPHVILAIDGAYSECVNAEDYEDGLKLAAAHENIMVLRTFSKIYGLPNLRLGWGYGAAGIVDAVNRIKSPFNVNGAAQAAGLAALQDIEWTNAQQRHVWEAREWLSAQLVRRGLHVYPSQGNFVLADTYDVDKARRIISQLEAKHIYIRDVTSYKLPTCMRISVGTVEENTALINALDEIIQLY